MATASEYRKLKTQMKILSYTLFLVDLVDSKARCLLPSIYNGLIEKTAAALQNGMMAQVRIDELVERELYNIHGCSSMTLLTTAR
jgi:hypothetical protein